ncbi:MAG: 50S ribosomal protein L5 [Candidatus Aureabacteria bacterium]|nr:50S ribosomal protein L5 [Candidatus Auribacterota bacterium]
MARMSDRYRDLIVPELMKEFGYKNKLQVPRLQKIVINMGVGEAMQDSKMLDDAAADLALIAGQRPMMTKSRKDISNFKLRAGLKIGCKVTLRGARMYEFFDRFVNVALPRIRDFRGLSPKSFDGRGNYSLGLSEQVVFPELDLDKVKRTQGMDIVFVTTAKTDEEARSLLKQMGVPFAKKQPQPGAGV